MRKTLFLHIVFLQLPFIRQRSNKLSKRHNIYLLLIKNEDNVTSSVEKAIKERVLGLVGVNGAPELGYKEQTATRLLLDSVVSRSLRRCLSIAEVFS